MKELEKDNLTSEKQDIEVIQEKKQQQELKYESSILPFSGHKVFEINTKTLDVKEASYLEHKRITWHQALRFINGKERIDKEIIRKKNCIYISALNADNALKRYKNNKKSASILEVTNKLRKL